MKKKRFNKFTLKIIATIVLLAISATFFTVNAWFVRTQPGIGINGAAEIKAAKIGLKASINIISDDDVVVDVYGIPGETLDVEITLEDADSTRAYVYEIVIPNGGYITSFEENVVGDVTVDDTVIRGIWEKDNFGQEITIPLKLYFYGKEVVDYDGNLTQEDSFSLKDISVKYCQATPAAIEDVFGLGITIAHFAGGN